MRNKQKIRKDGDNHDDDLDEDFDKVADKELGRLGFKH
jgi:hypothetical protein